MDDQDVTDQNKRKRDHEENPDEEMGEVKKSKIEEEDTNGDTEEDEDEDVEWNYYDEEDDYWEEKERKKEMMTLHDLPLPDDIIFKIIKYGNLGRGLRLRLNKTMEERIHNLLKLKSITLSGNSVQFKLFVDGHESQIKPSGFWNVDRLRNGLLRWSKNTHVYRIFVDAFGTDRRSGLIRTRNEGAFTIDDNLGKSINALCQFVADELRVDAKVTLKIPHIDITSLLTMSANIREVRIDHICSSLTALDLCTLRNKLLSGDCKMGSFNVVLNDDVAKEFIRICFDVLIREGISANLPQFPGVSSHRTIVYDCATDAMDIQLYAYDKRYPKNTIHFEGELKTEVDENRLSFTKVDADVLCQMISTLAEIKLNFIYTMTL